MIPPFHFANTPQLHFGLNKIRSLPALISVYGPNVLLVSGAKSFINSPKGKEALSLLDGTTKVQFAMIAREPSPQMIDKIVDRYASENIRVVVAIGGGSVLDAGKAIAAMLPLREQVKPYLEGVGTKSHPGAKLPFIAVPTTSGTGSEATKNAVLSETGPHGFKRSLRHNNFVPDVAIVDPSLTISCSSDVTASSGMDAFTQLLESYLSTASNNITDALALEGLRLISRSLKPAFEDGENIEARSDMSLAAYLSGITLANAGLGLVHGFAASIGGYFEIPHGVVCSTLMGPANRWTVKQLRKESNTFFLKKYSEAGKIFASQHGKHDDYYIDHLLDLIARWTEEMSIARLSGYSIGPEHFKMIVDVTDNKNNPVKICPQGMNEILRAAL
jgi:alcohol dehydrogenase class IV